MGMGWLRIARLILKLVSARHARDLGSGSRLGLSALIGHLRNSCKFAIPFVLKLAQRAHRDRPLFSASHLLLTWGRGVLVSFPPPQRFQRFQHCRAAPNCAGVADKPRPPPLSREQPIGIGTSGKNPGPGGHRAAPWLVLATRLMGRNTARGARAFLSFPLALI
jgi:hypothetical protein